MKTSHWWRMAFIAWFVLGTVSAFSAEPSSSVESPTTAEPTKEERLQALLAETLPESDYRELTRCLSTHLYSNIEVLSDRYLIFKGRRDRVWINRLRQRCVGLNGRHILQFQLSGRKVCDMDRVNAIDRSFGGVLASCSLGQFEKIDELQAAALKEAFRQARRS